MKLTDEDLTELQAIWKEVFGEDITPSFAKDRGNALLELYLLMGKLTAEVPPTDQDQLEPDASELSLLR